MARTRLPIKKPEISSSDLVDRFSNLSLKKNKMKKNSGRISLSPVIEIQRKAELTAKMRAQQLAKKVANHSKGSPRPAIPLLLYTWVQEAVELINRPGLREDDAYLKLAESKICFGCSSYSPFLPVGWKYQRENASSLIAGYETVFEMDEWMFIM